MWFPGRKEGETEESYGAVHRDGDFSIKGGNLGVVKKISINILKIKSVEELMMCFIDVITYVFEPL